MFYEVLANFFLIWEKKFFLVVQGVLPPPLLSGPTTYKNFFMCVFPKKSQTPFGTEYPVLAEKLKGPD